MKLQGRLINNDKIFIERFPKIFHVRRFFSFKFVSFSQKTALKRMMLDIFTLSCIPFFNERQEGQKRFYIVLQHFDD